MPMQIDSLLEIVVAALDEGKGRDVKIIDLRGKTAIADFFVIASGTSDRHVRSLAGGVEASAKAHALHPFGLEGEDSGEWVVVDLGDVVVHVMKPPVREFYQLEKLWAETFPAAA
ncbi:ribosome silencing factor [Methylococcus geothermalis]|uniref:Ribosomal silencing factor RsfS n=1 Tax=Methylococcus geothermalis TaxID=2681310 RepID=A0A858Q767_9GAMM|nr:ribosome silencing factor [Methylococcus geothermalis]